MAIFYIESGTGRQVSDLSTIDPTKSYIQSGTGQSFSGASLKPVAPIVQQPVVQPQTNTEPLPGIQYKTGTTELGGGGTTGGTQPTAQPTTQTVQNTPVAPVAAPAAAPAPAPQGAQPQNVVPESVAPVSPFGPNSYTGPSIVDYLNAAGFASDKASRAKLAQQYGVQNYDYSAEKNTELLGKLRATSGPNSQQTPQLPAPPVEQTMAGQTGDIQEPQTETGQDPAKNIIDAWMKISEDLGLNTIKSAYEKTLNDQKEIQDKLDEEIADINNDPWNSEGVRNKKVARAQQKYENQLSTLSNYAKLYDSLYQEGRQTAEFLVGEVQKDIRFNIELAQKKQEAIDKLLEKDHEFVEANGRRLLVNKADGTIIADLGVADVVKAGAASGKYTPVQDRYIDQINTGVANNFSYKAVNSAKSYADGVVASLAQGTGLGDIAAINQFQKVIDEGAVTRDQDVKLVQGSQSFINTLKTQIARLEKGEQLSPTARAQMRDAVTKLYEAKVRALQDDPYVKAQIIKAQQNNIDTNDTILGQLGSFGTGSSSEPEYPPGTILVSDHIQYMVQEDGQLLPIGSAL